MVRMRWGGPTNGNQRQLSVRPLKIRFSLGFRLDWSFHLTWCFPVVNRGQGMSFVGMFYLREGPRKYSSPFRLIWDCFLNKVVPKQGTFKKSIDRATRSGWNRTSFQVRISSKNDISFYKPHRMSQQLYRRGPELMLYVKERPFLCVIVLWLLENKFFLWTFQSF